MCKLENRKGKNLDNLPLGETFPAHINPHNLIDSDVTQDPYAIL